MTTPKTTIFIKSYPGDYVWLTHCLRSIRKFVTGHQEIVLVIPEGHPFPVENARVITCREWKDAPKPGMPTNGYLYQTFVKMCADKHCPEAEVILYVDSDFLFKRPFDVSEMFEDGKLKLLRRRWENAENGIIWRAPSEHALGTKCEYDTMAAPPAIHWAETIRRCREAVEAKQRQKIEYYIRTINRFSEFVTLGNYALQHMADRYHVIDDHTTYPDPIHLFWSWGGFNAESEAIIERTLA